MSDDRTLLERLRLEATALAEWERLGLVERQADGSFSPHQLERIRVLRAATERGISPQRIAASLQDDDDVLGRYLLLTGSEHDLGASLDEAAQRAGLDRELVRRLWVASGNREDAELFPEDIQSLRGIAVALEAGLPEEALVQVARVFGDALGRVADAEVRLFHFYVHEAMRREGMTGEDLSEATTASATTLARLLEPTVLYYHQQALERAMQEDILLHLAEEVEPDAGATGQMSVAVLFVDLAGFTSLTDVMGDAAAATVLDRFSDLVRETVSRSNGRVIKQIGDEFMLVFPQAAEAVSVGLELCRRVAGEHEFPGVRMGAHGGPALYREADYLGSTVNVAARVTAAADRGQFLATEALRDLAGGDADQPWRRLGPVELKGVAQPVMLYEVTGPLPDRGRDPVCGMELVPGAAAVRLRRAGRDIEFCSENCKQRFVADPDRYSATQ